jgi:ribosome-associated toxin RatA of RatAB toxin-antitoxin module
MTFIPPRLQKHCRAPLNCVGAIALGTLFALTPVTFASAKTTLDTLSAPQKATLESGQATLEGQEGQYTCRVLVTASVDTVWKVLTDYNNFENYYPNVVASDIVENKGTRKIFEQIYVVQALIFQKEERVRIAATESYPKQVVFDLIEGEVKSLKGTWQIEPIGNNRVLITHKVSVDPGPDDRELFFGIYEDSLATLLKAVKQQAEQYAAN